VVASHGTDPGVRTVSLDISLISLTVEPIPCVCLGCGNEHTREVRPQPYSANITHNLEPMARAAGIYAALWRGEDVETAADLAIVLHEGLTILRADPERFKRYDAPNGWGTYRDFVPWLEGLLQACDEHPDAQVVCVP